MATFRAYFDASGHPDSQGQAPALFVSGFIASVERWESFEERWLALLDHYHIQPPFHTTEFEYGKGQYKALRQDEAACDAFREEAIDIMTRFTNKAFSVGVVLPDLRRFFTEYDVPAELPRHAYPWCGLQVLRLVRRWASNRVKAGTVHSTDQVQLVFQHGDKHQGEFAKAATRAFGLAPLFLETKAAVPFQACDYLAWEHRRWLSQRRGATRPPKPRNSIIRLGKRIASDSSLYEDWATLTRRAKELGWSKRVDSIPES